MTDDRSITRPGNSASLRGATPIERAREGLREQEDESDRRRSPTRRIVGAGIVIFVVAVLSFVVLPAVGLTVSPVFPLTVFAVIAVGAIASAAADRRAEPDEDEELLGEAAERGAYLFPGVAQRDDERPPRSEP